MPGDSAAQDWNYDNWDEQIEAIRANVPTRRARLTQAGLRSAPKDAPMTAVVYTDDDGLELCSYIADELAAQIVTQYNYRTDEMNASGLHALLTQVKNEPIDIAILACYDRLSAQLEDFDGFLDLITAAGTEVVVVRDD